MVFITTGMGGGTGTGAAPIIASVAKEMGILTVAVVTKPFDFENRIRVAESGVEELTRHVDSLIVVLNDKLHEELGEDVTQDEAFAAANDVLKNAVGGIAEIINVEALVNVDFEDVRTVMGEPGKAMMGTAVASGPDRARIAAEQAVACPLLEGVDMRGAKGVLVLISAAKGSLKLSESKLAMNTIRAFAAPDAHVIYGTAYDESLGDALRVTVVATGLSRAGQRQPFTVVQSQPQQGLRTGTDNMPFIPTLNQAVGGAGAAAGAASGAHPNVPRVWLNPRSGAASRVEALASSGMDDYEIPAFLRKQAD
jgi:cell division protein FtsZ